ncbi:hypothetical protein [Deinococcus soli (ex Cha et al. 2016)]|uniref:Uncharacterized protein n=2 Tax=Deinococcus soli (ex Cha et al. 2016) TaxID=1309411 RepID=A0ACC6KHI7_9DEIO|nr:hypothetical protein [Deinococcus soli (ex Cha et al. 2016)]MDR6218802.1 hypothetical protein [Deinococcus soli (ex Cha et al. 2016)]MDR6328599.1 hypothetical protein [Deinococcus soli (ex Cha et al. 2016)]MDR6751914.1 hypothetical protein [Deinococcus soli (ex Cha et al. 2016)]
MNRQSIIVTLIETEASGAARVTSLVYHSQDQAEAEVAEVNAYAALRGLKVSATWTRAAERGVGLIDYVGDSGADGDALEAAGWVREAGSWRRADGDEELTLPEALVEQGLAPRA